MGRVHRRTFLARAARLSGGAVAASTLGSGLFSSFAEVASDLDFDFGAGASNGKKKGGGFPQPPVITRAQWGADEARRRGGRRFRAPRKFVVHHTVTPNRNPNPARTVRDIYDMHLARYEAGRYWSDIGYHFLVAPDGRIFEGRYAREFGDPDQHDGEDRFGRAVVGSHAGEVNGGSMGIALMGDFSSASPTAAAVDSLVELLTWKCLQHDLNPTGREPFLDSTGAIRDFHTIVGHRQVRTTACPGGAMQRLIPRVRHAVELRMKKHLDELRDRSGGYHVLSAGGLVVARGAVTYDGDPWHEGRRPGTVAVASTPDGKGYWLLNRSGHVGVYGRAKSYGSAEGENSAAVDVASTPSGKGYWVLTAGGRVLPFGDAAFHGSVRQVRDRGEAPPTGADPAVAFAPTPSGKGYWVASAKGRVYAFGDAHFQGGVRQLRQRGRSRSNEPVADIAAAPDGRGYWVLGREGSVFGFGSAGFHGSPPAAVADSSGGSGGVAISSSHTGRGYHVLTSDGAVLAFGDARFRGHGPALPAVDLAGEHPRPLARLQARRPRPAPEPSKKRKKSAKKARAAQDKRRPKKQRVSAKERRRRRRRRERRRQGQ